MAGIMEVLVAWAFPALFFPGASSNPTSITDISSLGAFMIKAFGQDVALMLVALGPAVVLFALMVRGMESVLKKGLGVSDDE